MHDNAIHGDVQVLVDELIFTESPRWHDGAFWFSDIGGGTVNRVTPDGQRDIVLSGMNGPSGLGWTSAGDMLVACLMDSTIYRVGPDRVPRAFCGPEQHGTFNTNDMATAGSRSYVTCSGRAYQAGDDESALSVATGAIILLDHDSGACRTVASGMKMPNGVAITPDGQTLIVAELYANRVVKFDIRADGTLSELRVLADLDHIVDGLCLDAEGGLWLGTGLDRFQRILADGTKAEAVHVPGWSCVAPMLGGPDGCTLLMCASRMDSPAAIFEGRAKSRVLTARVAVPAARQATFA